jgi:tetratricopeptide (TPR) repeat protein
LLAAQISGLLTDAEPNDAGRVYALLGEVATEVGDAGRARELYELAADFLERNTPNRYLVDVYAKLADLLEEQGDADTAYAYMKRAIGMQQAVAPKRPL